MSGPNPFLNERLCDDISYLVQQQVQRAIAHELGDDAEELGLVADAKDLDDVVEPGFVEHLGLLQQAIPLSETQRVNLYSHTSKYQNSDDICSVLGVHTVTRSTPKECILEADCYQGWVIWQMYVKSCVK